MSPGINGDMRENGQDKALSLKKEGTSSPRSEASSHASSHHKEVRNQLYLYVLTMVKASSNSAVKTTLPGTGVQG